MTRVPGVPFDPVAYFDSPSLNADFLHWSRAPFWTLEEGIALSLGKDPKQANWQILSRYYSGLPLAQEFAARFEIANRSVVVGQLGPSNAPGHILGWARRLGYEVPEDLVRLVEENGQVIGDFPELIRRADLVTKEALALAAAATRSMGEIKVKYEAMLAAERTEHASALGSLIGEFERQVEKYDALMSELEKLQAAEQGSSETEGDLKPKERTTLLKLFLGLVLIAYKADPKTPRSGLAKLIVDDLASFDIKLDEGTVRKWLGMAADAVEYQLPK